MNGSDCVTRRTVLGVMAMAGVSVPVLAARSAREALGTSKFPKTSTLTRGQAGQIFCAKSGATMIDSGFGSASEGAALTADALVYWASAVKPTTCAAVMRLVERGRVALTDPVAKHVPEFAVHGKGDVLIRHLMNHSAYLGGYDGPIGLPAFAETIARISAAPRTPARGSGGIVPPTGTVPAYNPAGIWMLAEILRRIHDRPFADIIRTEIFEPCGMVDSWNGMSRDRLSAYGERAAVLAAGPLALRGGIANRLGRSHGRGASGTAPSEGLQTNPAGGGVGPCRDLGRFYQMLLNGGQIGGRRVLKRETVEQMTTLSLSDGRMWAWGLGLNLNVLGEVGGARGEGRFGSRASPRAFGHAGASGITGFADPAHGLVITAIPAGDVLDAIYEDLRLA